MSKQNYRSRRVRKSKPGFVRASPGPHRRRDQRLLVIIAVVALAALFAARRIMAPVHYSHDHDTQEARPDSPHQNNSGGEQLTPQDNRALDDLIRRRSH